jgi:hypothetical protein
MAIERSAAFGIAAADRIEDDVDALAARQLAQQPSFRSSLA